MRDQDRPVLLVAYDSPYPAPLSGVRDIGQAFGVALVLSPKVGSGPEVHVCLMKDSPHRTRSGVAGLDALAFSNPAARSLPVLELLATGASGSVTLEYLPGCTVLVTLGG